MNIIRTPILFTVRILIGTLVTALAPLFLFLVFALLLDYLVSPTRRLKRVLVSANGMLGLLMSLPDAKPVDLQYNKAKEGVEHGSI